MFFITYRIIANIDITIIISRLPNQAFSKKKMFFDFPNTANYDQISSFQTSVHEKFTKRAPLTRYE